MFFLQFWFWQQHAQTPAIGISIAWLPPIRVPATCSYGQMANAIVPTGIPGSTAVAHSLPANLVGYKKTLSWNQRSVYHVAQYQQPHYV